MNDEPQVTHGHESIPSHLWDNIEYARNKGRNYAYGCVTPSDQQRVWDVLKQYDIKVSQSPIERAMKSYYFKMTWSEE